MKGKSGHRGYDLKNSDNLIIPKLVICGSLGFTVGF